MVNMAKTTPAQRSTERDSQTIEMDPLAEAAIRHAEAGIGHSADQVFEWLDDWAAGNKKTIAKPGFDRKKRSQWHFSLRRKRLKI